MYKKVSEAPTYDQLLNMAKAQKKHISSIILEESEIYYLARDNNFNEFLVQNPALMTHQCAQRCDVITRRAAIRLADAPELPTMPGKRRNKRREAA